MSRSRIVVERDAKHVCVYIYNSETLKPNRDTATDISSTPQTSVVGECESLPALDSIYFNGAVVCYRGEYFQPSQSTIALAGAGEDPGRTHSTASNRSELLQISSACQLIDEWSEKKK